jgi:hypothetical protein
MLRDHFVQDDNERGQDDNKRGLSMTMGYEGVLVEMLSPGECFAIA